ncbi:STAS domain-containing protein [Parvibium lacunae]|uniref:STAS domain-containing protein n=1 Tax=Parvibium lacunae TaxID=1888893 RepID=A0A368L4X6_9BURK|nr:STAS domain-containing protein [Parvibium lacunae]RCS58639.1 STAS domain-containing protein [Parvibium lacunae]
MIFSLFGKSSKPDASKNEVPGKAEANSKTSDRRDKPLPSHGSEGRAQEKRSIRSPESASRSSTSSSNRSSSSSASGSSSKRTRPSVSPEVQRELALATKAKIDAIESEMALDFGAAPPPPPKTPAPLTPPVKNAGKEGVLAMPTKKDINAVKLEHSSTLPPLDATTSIILGDETGALSVEISTTEVAPIVEEVAILYANGQSLAASMALAGALKQDDIGPSTMQAWFMLFDLYHLMGKRADFEGLAIDFVSKFEISPPAWDAGSAVTETPVTPGPVVKPGQAVVIAALDEKIDTVVSQLVSLAEKQPQQTLDFSQLGNVTFEGCQSLLGFLRQVAKNGRPELQLLGLPALLAKLLETVETGRRDPLESGWMLLLEVYRILNQQAEFEEASINYCITYEVSPPSWETPVGHIRVGQGAAASQAEPAATPANETAPEAAAPTKWGQSFSLSGELEGNAEVELSGLMTYAETNARVSIDCRNLRRVDFTAAGALLNALVGLQASGRKVEFFDLNHLVAALFIVMGIHQFAALNLRKL